MLVIQAQNSCTHPFLTAMILAVKNHWFESVTYASVLCIALHINLRIALQFLLQEQQTLPYYVAYGYDNDIRT